MEGYVATTEKYTPKLLAEVRQAVADLKAAGVPVPFVLQIGDLVEGLCGSEALQSLQFRDATAAVDAAAFGVPTLVTKGNHDVTGPGAPAAFDKVLLPWLSKQAGEELRTASYVRRQGDDLFVFFDAYKPDLDWLAKTLEAKENKARQVFFAIHPPVVPYNARADWHVFARDNQREKRDKLLSLLGRYRAMVLSGHLHKYSLLTRRTAEGPVAQLAVCSVLRSEREKPKDVLDGVAKYGPDLVDLEPKHAPETAGKRRELLAAEAPLVDRFEYADVAGYAVVKVYRDRVDADLYAGVGQGVWKARPLAQTAGA
jgi:3',5'-cyclic AMP phosphodiesterase CpdA